MTPNELLIRHALSLLNIPYLYGGKNVLTGLDCSGFCCEILKGVGLIGYHEELTAQGLYAKFSSQGIKQSISGPTIGSLIFYGVDNTSIVHVALALNGYSIIECGGGNETTTTLDAAKALGACVRIRSANMRTDKYEAFLPKYPWLQSP